MCDQVLVLLLTFCSGTSSHHFRRMMSTFTPRSRVLQDSQATSLQLLCCLEKRSIQNPGSRRLQSLTCSLGGERFFGLFAGATVACCCIIPQTNTTMAERMLLSRPTRWSDQGYFWCIAFFYCSIVYSWDIVAKKCFLLTFRFFSDVNV